MQIVKAISYTMAWNKQERAENSIEQQRTASTKKKSNQHVHWVQCLLGPLLNFQVAQSSDDSLWMCFKIISLISFIQSHVPGSITDNVSEVIQDTFKRACLCLCVSACPIPCNMWTRPLCHHQGHFESHTGLGTEKHFSSHSPWSHWDNKKHYLLGLLLK